MDASRGKKLSSRGTAARRVAVVGKENICPSISREPLTTSRSPLPEGFLRAPLQDITHMLSPINVPLNDGDAADHGACKPLRKRSKCLPEIEMPSASSRCNSKPHPAVVDWRGLQKCGGLEASVRIVQVEAEVKHTEGADCLLVEAKFASNVEFQDAAKMEAVEEGHHPTFLDAVEAANKERLQETVLMLPKGVMEEEKKGEGELNSGLQEPPFLGGPLRPEVLKRPHIGRASSSTRASLRSAQEKPKMSSLMKFR